MSATNSSEFAAETDRVSTLWFDKKAVQQRGIWTADDLIGLGHCPLCSSADFHYVTTRQDGLPIQECNLCGLAFVDPRPGSEQLADYYGKGYFTGAKDFFKDKDYCLERDKSLAARAITGYQEIISHFDVKEKVILDIGCASGALLHLLRQEGAREVIGIDSAEYPVSFGRSTYGLDLRCETLESANLPDGHFDLVTLIDVLEHVDDLNAFLRELRRVLKPGGNVFIITPNYKAHLLARGEWTCLYKDFEHLQYFGPQSISELCASSRLIPHKTWTDSLPFRVFEYPRVHKNRLHSLLHPRVAAKNRLAQLKYLRVSKNDASLGANLNLVLAAGS